MSMYDEHLIGFDARSMTLPNGWDETRRQKFLINTRITQPISIDSRVLPLALNLTFSDYRDFSLGWYYPFWSSLARLKKFLNSPSNVTSNQYTIIAATTFLSKVAKDIRETNILHQPLSPNGIDPNWTLLGYDIAGSGFISSLANMGYGSEKISERVYFLEYLNQYHLFDNFDTALEYERWSEEQDSVHGPYYVYGIYKIE